MTPESHGDEVASTTQVVNGRGPEPKQIGDLILREHVGSFERAIAPRPFGCVCPAASHPRFPFVLASECARGAKKSPRLGGTGAGANAGKRALTVEFTACLQGNHPTCSSCEFKMLESNSSFPS